MQQRVGLAQSLLNDPKLLFLDEPTGGLDPIAHREIRDLILSFRERGRTVFISSHELSEVELICDRVAIINRGVVERQGKLTDLLRGGRIEITLEGVDDAYLRSLSIGEANVRSLPLGILLDMPEEQDPNGIIDAVREGRTHRQRRAAQEAAGGPVRGDRYQQPGRLRLRAAWATCRRQATRSRRRLG